TGGKMVLTDDAQALETRHLGFTISPHEECAVEEAVRIVEAEGGEVVVMTLGPAEAEEQLRDCMAIGADRGILLETQGEEWDAQATAGAIVEALHSEPEPFDLLFFGNESADAGGYQVGIRVAHALGLPIVTGLKKIDLRDRSVRRRRGAAGARSRVNVLCFVEPGDELSAQAVGVARSLGDVRAVTFDGAYQPAAWAKALAAQPAEAIVAAGSDRGNEVLAHVGAILDRPFAANVTAIAGDVVTRQRWGGSLVEEARLHGSPQLLTV